MQVFVTLNTPIYLTHTRPTDRPTDRDRPHTDRRRRRTHAQGGVYIGRRSRNYPLLNIYLKYISYTQYNMTPAAAVLCTLAHHMNFFFFLTQRLVSILCSSTNHRNFHPVCMSGSVDLFSTDRQTRSSVVKVGESLVGCVHEGRAGTGSTPARMRRVADGG